MALTWYDLTLTRHNRATGPVFSDALDLDDVACARAELYLEMRAAIVRTRGDLVMTYATHGEVQR
jgi:hypothetical protein